MGFNLFINNRMEILAETFAGQLREHRHASPFTPDLVVVQSAGMQHWLRLRLASANGICANVQFKFLREIADELMYSAQVIERGRAFSENSMLWMILRLFSDDALMNTPVFRHVRDYFSDSRPELKKFQLADQLASIFDRYIIYRPDWLLAWERHAEVPELRSDPHAPWQAELWRQMVALAGGPWHYAAFRDRFIARLRSGHAEFLPERITIFGISNMPRFFLDIFAECANFCEVDLFYLNPCMEDWSYAYSKREIARLGNPLTPCNLQYLYSGNDLLASFGQAGRDYFKLLLDHVELGFEDWLVSDAETGRNAPTMLTQLQSDILELGNSRRAAPPAPGDDSIIINACYSEQREIEVLLDQLLALIKSDAVPPSEIVVMAPDITQYAPYIEAVFGQADSGEAVIPYTVADRLLTADSHILGAFLKIIALHSRRFTTLEVMEIFSTPAVYRRFDLDEDDLPLIRHHLNEANIRWSWDGVDKEYFGLPPDFLNSWEFGFERLLTGLAYGPTDELIRGIAPCPDFEGDATRVVGQFSCFVRELHEAIAAMRTPALPEQWLELFQQLLSTFFSESNDYVLELQQLRVQLDRLGLDRSGFDTPVPVDVVADFLQSRLSPLTRPGRFCRGGVTFCSLAPMRSVPFQVIALLGMNNDSFPRNPRRPNFDLRDHYPRQGDVTRRIEDRYIFLETLISARSHLVISYIGQDIKSNEALPPSVVVSELIDYLNRAYPGQTGDRLVRKHPLQPFSPRYFRGVPPLFSFSRTSYQCANALLNRPAEPDASGRWHLPPATRTGEDVIPLQELCRFLNNPARSFISRRLKSRLEVRQEDELRETENFQLDPLERYQLADGILEILLTAVSPDAACLEDLYAKLHAAGDLPAGENGRRAFDSVAGECLAIRQTILDIVDGEEPLRPASIDIRRPEYSVTGVLDSLYPGKQLFYYFSSSYQKYLLSAWTAHLALHASGLPPRPTHLVCKAPHHYRIAALSQDEAAAELRNIIEFYRHGTDEPFCFFPATSVTLVRAMLENGPDAAAREARKSWYSDRFSRGDDQDTYVKACFGADMPPPELLEAVARPLLEPLLARLSMEDGK